MIEKLEITGKHFEIDPKLKKYAKKKIGQLDKYIPRKSRESVHVELILAEDKSAKKDKYMCEAIVYLPKETIAVKEATVNMFAAVDIVEAKLRNQFRKYKEIHGNLGLHRRVLARLRGKR